MSDIRSSEVRRAVFEIAENAPLPPHADTLAMRVRPTPSRKPVWPSLLAVAAVIGVVVGLVTLARPDRQAVAPGATDTAAVVPTLDEATVVATDPAPSSPIAASPAGQLQSHVEFPGSTMAAGSSMSGFLVIDNPTNETMSILDRGCAPKWVVVLSDDLVAATAAFTTDCVTSPLELPPGETRLDVAIDARYHECTQDPQQDSTPELPLVSCVGSPPEPPPLPIGEYSAVFVGGIPSVTPPEPVRIAVTAAPTGQLESRLEFPSATMATGTTMNGFLVVNNTSGETVSITDPGCTSKWGVVLSNDRLPAAPAFTMDCPQGAPMLLSPGETSLPFFFTAEYQECSNDTTRDTSQVPTMVSCLGSPPAMPPLPADQYMAVFGGSIPGVAPPAPFPIMVTAAAS